MLGKSITVATAMLVGLGASPVHAQTYPSKPITLVVPFTPGGTTDIVGRIVAEGLGKKMGQPVVIDNRGGAGGNIGAALVANAKPDGYTLLMGYNGTNAVNPSLYKNLSWDPIKSFDPVGMVARVNNVVVVNPSLPIKTLPELLAYAKAHPNELNYGSAGPGSIFHLAGEMMSNQANVKMSHVPYKGAAPALSDLMAGQVQVMFSTIPTALPFIKAGKLRAIAVTGAERSPVFPQLPTAKEAGYPGMVVDSWFGVFLPKGAPADVRSKLEKAVKEVVNDPAVIEKLRAQGAEPKGSTPAQLASTLSADLATWHEIITTAKVSLE